MTLLATLFGCVGGTATVAGQLPATFTPTVVVEAGGPWVFGFEGGPFAPLTERRLAQWRPDGVGLPDGAAGPAGEGWFQGADARGDVVWAVAARKRPDVEAGSLYTLWRWQSSGPGSGTWTEGGAIPASSLTGIAVEDADSGWAIGVRHLWRTEDGGRTWNLVEGAPAAGDVPASVAVRGAGQAVVAGARLLYTADAGRSWAALSDTPVHATDGTWAVARTDSGVRVGRLDPTVTWVGEHAGQWMPHAVAEGGGRLRVLASRADRAGLVVLESGDGGRTFDEQRVTGATDPTWVGLGDKVWAVDTSRRVKGR